MAQRGRSWSRRLADPRGRDIVVWIGLVVTSSIRLASGDGGEGWRLWVDLLLLTVGLAGTGLAAVRIRRYRGVPAPDECPACGHLWREHAQDRVVDGTCGGCALEVEHGVAPRVAGGCRRTPPGA